MVASTKLVHDDRKLESQRLPPTPEPPSGVEHVTGSLGDEFEVNAVVVRQDDDCIGSQHGFCIEVDQLEARGDSIDGYKWVTT